VIVALGFLVGGAARATPLCAVEGSAVDALVVDVAPKGAAPLHLRVAGLAASAQPDADGKPVRIKVKGLLGFEGTAPPDRPPYKTRRFVDAASGMVRLAQATDGLTLRARSARWVDAEVALGKVRLRWLSLPCDSLTLDTVPRPELRPVEEGGGETWVPAGQLLHLRSEPGAGAAMEVVIDDAAAREELELRQRESAGKGSWLRVASGWADGTTLVGWARREELARPSGRARPVDELPVAPPGCARDVVSRAGARLRPARVAAGTIVYAARYLGPWATARGGEVTVRAGAKDDWVEIVSVAGIVSAGECADNSTVLDDAWVPRASVRFLDDATSSGDGGAP
jgi:hypothetical protein